MDVDGRTLLVPLLNKYLYILTEWKHFSCVIDTLFTSELLKCNWGYTDSINKKLSSLLIAFGVAEVPNIISFNILIPRQWNTGIFFLVNIS